MTTSPHIEAPSLYFKLEQVGSEWVTRQLAYLSTEEVAELLGVSRRTVQDYVNASEHPLPFIRIPGSRMMRFKPGDVEKWLEDNQE